MASPEVTPKMSGFVRGSAHNTHTAAKPTSTGTLTTKASPTTRQDHSLHRGIGSIGLLFASVGSIIGSGWLFGSMVAAQAAGPSAIISWSLGGVMILVIALCYAELGTMFPLSGGVVRYPHVVFGGFASYMTGWINWIAALALPPIEVMGALTYATKYGPFTHEHVVSGQTVHTLTPLGIALAVLLMAVFVVINYFGIRWFSRINNVLVWWKLGIISLVVVSFVALGFHGSNFTAGEGFFSHGWHGVFTAIATSGIVFSFLGFRQGIELAGETSNPRRNVPLAVVGSVLICILIYVGLQTAFLGVLPHSVIANMGGHWSNLNFSDSFGPLAAISTMLGAGWLAVLLYIDAIVSPADTGLIYVTTTARISHGMARNGNAPAKLATTNRHGAPVVSMIVAFVVGLVLFLPFPSWQQMAGFISSATVLSFASGPLTMAALRSRLPHHQRTFKAPFGHLLPMLGFISSNLLVYWTGWTTDLKLFIAMELGLVLLAVNKAFSRHEAMNRYNMAFRAGFWYIPWLAGLAIISYLGDYDGGIGLLHFDTAVPVIIVFSLAIYWMAIHFSFPAERVEFLADAITREARGETTNKDATDTTIDPEKPEGDAVLAPVKA
ncbi:APC family permease [Corynebacterium kroppenstedtii]|nr:APC family permease [Corynebacterium kroppenstedtii]